MDYYEISTTECPLAHPRCRLFAITIDQSWCTIICGNVARFWLGVLANKHCPYYYFWTTNQLPRHRVFSSATTQCHTIPMKWNLTLWDMLHWNYLALQNNAIVLLELPFPKNATTPSLRPSWMTLAIIIRYRRCRRGLHKAYYAAEVSLAPCSIPT